MPRITVTQEASSDELNKKTGCSLFIIPLAFSTGVLAVATWLYHTKLNGGQASEVPALMWGLVTFSCHDNQMVSVMFSVVFYIAFFMLYGGLFTAITSSFNTKRHIDY